MLLAVDIGNSNVKFAFCRTNKVFDICRISSCSRRTADEYYLALRMFIDKSNLSITEIDRIIVSSVVPQVESIIFIMFKKYFFDPVVLNEDQITEFGVNVDMKFKIVGADRFLSMIAACNLWQNKNLMVIDFGTVTTFNLMDSSGRYYGQVITPGIESFVGSMCSSAALLPQVGIEKTTEVVQDNIIYAMQSGVFWGYISMITGMIERILHEEERDFFIVATGGRAQMCAAEIPRIQHVDVELTIKGLMLVADKLYNNL